MKTILLIDDHDIVRFGLLTLINMSPAHQVVDSQKSLAAGLLAIRRLAPDLVVCDMSMEDSKGLATVRAVVEAQSPRAVLMLSMHDEMMYAEQCLVLGARGYLMKERAHESVLQAIDTIFSGNTWVSPQVSAFLLNRSLRRNNTGNAAPGQASSLSQRELVVLEKMGMGRTTKEIALELALSPRTVDIHRAKIKKKLGFRTGVEVMAFAIART